MVIAPQLYMAKVMHKRLLPKVNAFNYGVYYLALPLPAAHKNFYAKDVGLRNGDDPLPWVRGILTDYGLNDKTKDIVLITMPRILGYVFNPVSFYMCLNNAKQLIAVLCEVHNTFGEQHNYLCANADHTPIDPHQWLEAEKVFHVSPFLQRDGHYKFRFNLADQKLGIWIDYYNAQGHKQLITSLIGQFKPLTHKNLALAFWQHPAVALKAIYLIHWQALKLMAKGIKYVTKPLQQHNKTTSTQNLTKM